jgi:hypothetical protein
LLAHSVGVRSSQLGDFGAGLTVGWRIRGMEEEIGRGRRERGDGRDGRGSRQTFAGIVVDWDTA